MLISISSLAKFTFPHTDSTDSSCKDILLELDQWLIRFVVTEVDQTPDGYYSLIPPPALLPPNLEYDSIPTRFSTLEVSKCARLPSDQLEKPCFSLPFDGENLTLIPASNLKHFGVFTEDGSLGRLYDLIIDSNNWSVSFVVTDSRNWIPLLGRNVAVPVSIVREVDISSEMLWLSINKENLKNSPELETHNGEIQLPKLKEISRYYQQIQSS